jgi:hypothetical protein
MIRCRLSFLGVIYGGVCTGKVEILGLSWRGCPMNKALFLSLSLVAVAFAGCTDEPPSGIFTATAPAADYSTASIVVSSTPAANNYPGGNSTGDEAECGADQVTEIDTSSSAPQCTEATSNVSMTPAGGAVLPAVDSSTGYTLYLIKADDTEFVLGPMADHGPLDGGNHYDYPATEFLGEDFTGAKEVQIRFDATVVATAPGNGGQFELSQGLQDFEADVNFTGREISVTLKNTPADAANVMVGWLINVETDVETGVVTKTHSVQILLAGNETMYTLTEAQGFVGDYEEFHVHVGASAINVAVAPIPIPVEE